jgi:hypothetical protein
MELTGLADVGRLLKGWVKSTGEGISRASLQLGEFVKSDVERCWKGLTKRRNEGQKSLCEGDAYPAEERFWQWSKSNAR